MRLFSLESYSYLVGFMIMRQRERGGDQAAVKTESGIAIHPESGSSVDFHIQPCTVDVQLISEMRTVDDGTEGDGIAVNVNAADFIESQGEPGSRTGKDRSDVLTGL